MYRYRCGTCATTSPVVRTRVEMYAERDRHRRRFHGGHRPDGERLQRYRRSPHPTDPQTIAWLIAIAAALLLAWITNH